MEELSLDMQRLVQFPVHDRVAVDEVPEDGEAFAGEVDTDLVHSPRMEFYFQE